MFLLRLTIIFDSDRQQLIQQIQMIGGGAHGPQAAAAIRHVAAQNGVWTLDNQLNAAVKSSVQFLPSNGTSSSELQGSQNAQSTEQDIQPLQQTRIEDHEYRSVFDNCSVGMVRTPILKPGGLMALLQNSLIAVLFFCNYIYIYLYTKFSSGHCINGWCFYRL